MLLGWGRWEDVLVFNFAGYSMLLQGRKHRLTNAKRFKVVYCSSFFQSDQCSNLKSDHLDAAGLTEFKQMKDD